MVNKKRKEVIPSELVDYIASQPFCTARILYQFMRMTYWLGLSDLQCRGFVDKLVKTGSVERKNKQLFVVNK